MEVRNMIAGAIGSLLLVPIVLAADPSPDHFIKEAIEGNLSEVKVGGLAQQKGSSQGVKDYGAALAKDHASANDKARQAAGALGVTPPKEPGAKQKMMYQELSGLSGGKFDEQFVQAMVKDHQEDIAQYEKQAGGSGPAAEYAKAILPDLRKHLQMAEKLRSQMRTASTSDGMK